jgi:hypothetical protein
MDGTTHNQTLPLLEEADTIVAQALERIRSVEEMKQVVTLFPVIGTINLRLAGFLSLRVKHPHYHMPLLNMCLRDALTAFGTSGATPHPEQRVRYQDALVHTASNLLRYDIRDDNGAWDPICGPPLLTWAALARHPVFNPTPSAARPLVAMATFERSLAQRLWGDMPVTAGETSKDGALA